MFSSRRTKYSIARLAPKIQVATCLKEVKRGSLMYKAKPRCLGRKCQGCNPNMPRFAIFAAAAETLGQADEKDKLVLDILIRRS